MNKAECEKIKKQYGTCPNCGEKAVHFGSCRKDQFKCTVCDMFIPGEKLLDKHT